MKKISFIHESSSNYGVFYGVFDWNDRRIKTHTDFGNTGTTETVNNIQYK